MKEETTTESSRVLRLFGADALAVQQAAGAFPTKWRLTAQCLSRGGETLLALQGHRPSDLEKGEQSLRACFPNDLYGEGGTDLAAAVVQALERHDRLLVCSDAAAGALVEARLEAVEGAEKVFDFGALSYAQKIAAIAARRAEGDSPVQQALARVQAAQKTVGAELSAGCVEQQGQSVLLLGTRKGCWLRTVRSEDKPGLWLLDMIRRAAGGLKQAEGTRWQKYHARTKAPQETPAVPVPTPAAPAAAAVAAPPKRHLLRRVLIALLLLVLAGFAGAWYTTGGDLNALPEVLGFYSLPHSGATLV